MKLTIALQTRHANKGVADRTSKTAELAVGDVLELVQTSLADSKAEEPVTIDIQGKSALGDYMIVASGRSHRHVGAIADHMLRDLKNAGCGTPRVEGLPNCDWVLIDTGDIIIHIFRPEVRDFYGIEKMWQMPEASEIH